MLSPQDNAPACIEDHDFQFWFGDLNYRIDRSRTDIIDALQTGNLEELQQDDQLRKQMQVASHPRRRPISSRAFVAFSVFQRHF